MLPAPLYIYLYDEEVARIVRWRLTDYKPGYHLFEYTSEASGKTILLSAEEAWKYAKA